MTDLLTTLYEDLNLQVQYSGTASLIEFPDKNLRFCAVCRIVVVVLAREHEGLRKAVLPGQAHGLQVFQAGDPVRPIDVSPDRFIEQDKGGGIFSVVHQAYCAHGGGPDVELHLLSGR